jgi:hypothetical protein
VLLLFHLIKYGLASAECVQIDQLELTDVISATSDWGLIFVLNSLVEVCHVSLLSEECFEVIQEKGSP